MSHSTARRRPLGMEHLENRELMASNISASLARNGILQIRGSDGNDQIYFSRVGNRINVEGAGQFAAGKVKGIVAVGLGGDDKIIILNPELRSGTRYISVPTLLVGGSGNDIITGGAGVDIIFGEDGNDSIFGTNGDDFIAGGNGDDYIHGGRGNDFLFGNSGVDRLLGSDGDDFLDGGLNPDRLDGGIGNDVLVGGSNEIDFLLPGSGVNYVIDNNFQYFDGGGTDQRLFYASQVDQVLPSANTRSVTALQSILGPNLYRDIVVNQTVPVFFRKV